MLETISSGFLTGAAIGGLLCLGVASVVFFLDQLAGLIYEMRRKV